MQRLIFHRSDVENILKTVQEAGRTLAAQQPDVEYLRGYAAALRLTAAGFGVPESLTEPPAQGVGVELCPQDRAGISGQARPRALPTACR
jgi:hypothetical protein